MYPGTVTDFSSDLEVPFAVPHLMQLSARTAISEIKYILLLCSTTTLDYPKIYIQPCKHAQSRIPTLFRIVCLINVLGGCGIIVLGGRIAHLFSPLLSAENEFSTLSVENEFSTLSGENEFSLLVFLISVPGRRDAY